MSERDALRMSEAEIAAALEEGRRAQLATRNPDGSIHLVPMSYVVYEGRVTMWTDTASRKVSNLRADPRLTCLVELGEDFQSFRAVELVGAGSLVTDYEASRKVGEALFARTVGALTDDMLAYVATLAGERVGIVVQADRVVSWDHRKLNGALPDQIGS